MPVLKFANDTNMYVVGYFIVPIFYTVLMGYWLLAPIIGNCITINTEWTFFALFSEGFFCVVETTKYQIYVEFRPGSLKMQLF